MAFYVKLLMVTLLLVSCKPRRQDVDIGKGNRTPGNYNKQSQTNSQNKNGGPGTTTDTDGTNQTGGENNGGNTGNNTGGTNTGGSGEKTTWTVDDFQGKYAAAKPLGKILSVYFPGGIDLRKMSANSIHIYNGKGAFLEKADNIGSPARYEGNIRFEATIIKNTLYVVRAQGQNVSRFDLTLTSASDLTVTRTTISGSTYTENETGYFKRN